MIVTIPENGLQDKVCQLYWLHVISVLKKRGNDSSTYFFSLLFQYQAGGDKIFCMAVYSPVLNRISRLASNERSQGKSFFQT